MSSQRRQNGWLRVGLACFGCAATGRRDHNPNTVAYPPHVLKRVFFTGGGGHDWRISALTTPRTKPAPWKIVVITGAPSFAEYWAPVMAALPADREMVVVDRPGYGHSEPIDAVLDIGTQAAALSPLLQAAPGQKILLVGQSYGAAIAALMAHAQPRPIGGLVLLSGYFGDLGPTARRLVDLGARTLRMIPRELRNAVMEVRGQPAQLSRARLALASVRAPVHVIHGDRDDFAPAETAERLVAETRGRLPMTFHRVQDADHFMTDGPAEELIAALEACIPKPRPGWAWADLGRLLPSWPAPAPSGAAQELARG